MSQLVSQQFIKTQARKQPKSNLRAYKVQVEDALGNKEDFFYAEPWVAHRECGRKARDNPLGKAHLFENAGAETYIHLATYTGGDPYPKTPRGGGKAAIKQDTARGSTQDDRWQDAMERPAVLIMMRRHKK